MILNFANIFLEKDLKVCVFRIMIRNVCNFGKNDDVFTHF